MTTDIKGRFLAAESPHMPTGNPGASAWDAGNRVVEIVTAMLKLDELLFAPDERGANNNAKF